MLVPLVKINISLIRAFAARLSKMNNCIRMQEYKMFINQIQFETDIHPMQYEENKANDTNTVNLF